MSCTKRPFDSEARAKHQLRVWQQRGRRSAFDDCHAYLADCDEHKGKFHIGHSQRSAKAHEDPYYTVMLMDISDDLEDVFERQHFRVSNKLARVGNRVRKRDREAMKLKKNRGDLLRPEVSTIVLGGDEFDVRAK